MRRRAALAAVVVALLGPSCTGSSGTGGAGGGCPNDLPPACPSNAPGYKATIAPILGVACRSCHEPGGSSLHYLQTYDEVFALRGPVLDQVYACKMPPSSYPALSPAERADLLAWLVCGAPND